MKARKYYKNIWADFNKEKEMIFISGARQTGKTTMAKDIASEEPVSHYFSYDVPENKIKILVQPSFFEEIDRLHELTELGDPFVVLNKKIKWESFRHVLETIRPVDKRR